jgi:hypothetical protein
MMEGKEDFSDPTQTSIKVMGVTLDRNANGPALQMEPTDQKTANLTSLRRLKTKQRRFFTTTKTLWLSRLSSRKRKNKKLRQGDVSSRHPSS